MKLTNNPDRPVTDEAILAETGKGWDDWFALLDKQLAGGYSRRGANDYLYGECKVDGWWTPTIVSAYESTRGQLEKDGKPKGFSICVTKTITAPLDDTYAAFASATALDRWLGSGHQADVTEGGQLANADGNRGTFKRVRPNKDLRLVWEDPACGTGTVVDIAFADTGKGKTGITLTQERIQSRGEADGLRAGWSEAFNRLKGALEGG